MPREGGVGEGVRRVEGTGFEKVVVGMVWRGGGMGFDGRWAGWRGEEGRKCGFWVTVVLVAFSLGLRLGV